MANENQQNDVTPSAQPPAVLKDAGLGQRGASRRRFARAGVGATGVLLTLASHPGMACTVYQSPSGWHSANTAKLNNIAVSAGPKPPSRGLPPSTWCGSSNWPCQTSMRFGSLFSCNSSNTSIKYGTLMAHCSGTVGTSGDKFKIAQLLSAAYLNVLSGRSPFLTQQILSNIWTEYQLKGTYTPMAGATPWNSVTILAYLTGTMD